MKVNYDPQWRAEQLKKDTLAYIEAEVDRHSSKTTARIVKYVEQIKALKPRVEEFGDVEAWNGLACEYGYEGAGATVLGLLTGELIRQRQLTYGESKGTTPADKFFLDKFNQ